MSAERFLQHVYEDDARFVCYRAGPDSPDRIEVSLVHEAGLPATAEQLAKLRELLGPHAAQVEALYSKHDGFHLYVQSREHSGLALLPVDEWEIATREFREDLEDQGRSLDEAFDFELHGLVFGLPTSSGNHFVLYDGIVYYADHDGGDDTPLATSFNAFLDRIVEDPARFLFEIGCYARYSDERTDQQWIPERYVSRQRKA